MNRKLTVFLLLFLFFFSTYAAIAFYATTPKPTQPFIGFGVYSQQRALSGYQGLSSKPPISVNQTVNWYLNITNQMGSIQFLQLIFRLGNTDLSSPNDTNPAPQPALANSTLFAPNGRTTIVNFDWKVIMVNPCNGFDCLTLSINGQKVTSNIGTPPGSQSRLFIELWTFDESSGSFRYYSWLQVWFRVST